MTGSREEREDGERERETGRDGYERRGKQGVVDTTTKKGERVKIYLQRETSRECVCTEKRDRPTVKWT